MSAATSVPKYMASLPEDRRGPMESLRAAIREGAPEAVETIAYAMPAYRSHGGQFLVSFDSYRRHYSLFPATDAVVRELGDEIRPYLAGKGTIRFPADRPLPIDLIRRIAAIRFGENASRATSR